jgi:hypothetical protein
VQNLINNVNTWPITVICHYSQLERLQELLESASLEVRMAAGETIAVLFELGRAFNEDFEETQAEALCDILRQLATDSHKYRAKKDRKTQRSSFRDILHFVEVSITEIHLLKNFNNFIYGGDSQKLFK